MSVVIYCRVSSDEQRRNETILTQLDFLRRYCDLQGLQIGGLYQDDGVSGTVPLERRPAGRHLLADLAQARGGTVLVMAVDRLGRDPRHILNAVHLIEETGAAIRSATEPFDTGNPAGRFLLTMLSGFAGYARESQLVKAAEGTERGARAGQWLGGIVPYGYRVVGERKLARLAVSEALIADTEYSESDVVRLIYRLTVEEHYSCAQIADYLNGLGIPTAYALAGRGRRNQRTANVWRPGRIRNMLANPTYYGRHVYGKRSANPSREPISREAPAIVEEATWRRAQQVLHEHQIAALRNARRVYLLRGLLVCGCCGLHYCGYSNGRRHYYRCDGYSQHSARGIYGQAGRACPSRQVPGAWLDDYVWSYCLRVLEHAADAEELVALPNQGQAESAAALLAEAAQLERLAGREQLDRQALLNLYRQGRITDSDLDGQLAQVHRETLALRERAGELRRRAEELAAVEGEVVSAAELVARCRATLHALGENGRAEVLRCLVRRVVLRTVGEGRDRRVVAEIAPVLTE